MSGGRSATPRLAVTHVTTFYPPTSFGGDGVHVERLAQAQARRGHRVRILHAPQAYHWLRGEHGAGVEARATHSDGGAGPDVDVRAYDGPGNRYESVLLHQWGGPVFSRSWLTSQILTARQDEVGVTHFHNVSLVAGMAGMSSGRGVRLYTPHEFWLVCPTHLLFRYGKEICTRRTCLRCTLHARRPPQLWRRFRRPERALGHVDSMVFPSATARDVYRAQGIQAEGQVLRHFLPEDYLERARARGARDPDTPPFCLYAGRLDAIKGIGPLLKQWVKADIEMPLKVAGDGPLAEELRRLHGSHARVELLGMLGEDTLGGLYRDAVALVMPSSGHEIFGQVVAEALAHETPVVASPHGGSAELAQVSGGGVIYTTAEELASAVGKLAVDSEERQRLGQLGREYVWSELREAAYLDRYEALVLEALP